MYQATGTAGASLASIDPAEYELALREAQARLAAYTVATIPDGSSNTILFTEQYSSSRTISSCSTTAQGAAAGNLWAYPGVTANVAPTPAWQWTSVFACARTGSAAIV